MNRATAFTTPLATATRIHSLELARRMIVLGSAAALMLAGKILPF
jgi:hypothetical protein